MNAPVLDAQLHVWESASPERPWLASVRTPAAAEFTDVEALKMMDAAGVQSALLITPIWSRFQDDYVFECAARYPDRFSAMVWFDPTAPDLRNRLAAVAGRPGFAGIRMLLTVPPGDAWLADGRLLGGPLDVLWPAAEELGVPVAVRLTDGVSELAPIAAAHPRLTLVVDHCAASEPGRDAFAALPRLLELACFSSMYVKLTALAKLSRSRSPYPDLDDVVRSVVDTFGADRCMWGSDITQYASVADYPAVVDQFRVGCRFLNNEQRAAILGRTARSVFGAEPRP